MKRNITRRKIKRGGSNENVLYLGMETDIANAIILVPSFTTLYSIGIKDNTFSETTTWKQDKKGMLQDLIEGGNYTRYKKGGCFSMTSWGKSKIISEKDDKVNNIWTVKFILNDKPREIIYYYNRNFLTDWPEEVKNIRHVIWIGSWSWESFGQEDYEDREKDELVKSLEERTTTPFFVYGHTRKTKKSDNVIYTVKDCEYEDYLKFKVYNYPIGRDLVDTIKKDWWFDKHIGY